MAYRIMAPNPGRARAMGAVVFLGCITLLGIAASLTPSPVGLGSHRQLGLPPCMMITISGYPCPTCGMTTAFAHTVRGNLLAAFRAQPTGMLLALATAAAAALSLSVLFTAKVWTVNWYRLPPSLAGLILVVAMLAGWGYKIATGVVSGSLPIGK